MKHACRDALAALDDRPDIAEQGWQKAIDLAEEAYPMAIRVRLIGVAAHSLGSTSELGRECGRRAYDILTERGAFGLMGPLVDALIPPEEAAGETG